MGPLLKLDAMRFTLIEMDISLTGQLTIVLSVIIPGLCLHLLYFGIFVIFYDITGFQGRDFLQIISIYMTFL